MCVRYGNHTGFAEKTWRNVRTSKMLRARQEKCDVPQVPSAVRANWERRAQSQVGDGPWRAQWHRFNPNPRHDGEREEETMAEGPISGYSKTTTSTSSSNRLVRIQAWAKRPDPLANIQQAVAKRAEEFSAAKARLSFAQAQEKKKAARRGDRRDPITDRRQLEAGSPYLQRRNDAAWMPNSWASSRMS